MNCDSFATLQTCGKFMTGWAVIKICHSTLFLFAKHKMDWIYVIQKTRWHKMKKFSNFLKR